MHSLHLKNSGETGHCLSCFFKSVPPCGERTATSSRNASHTSSSERAEAVGGWPSSAAKTPSRSLLSASSSTFPSDLDRAEGVPEICLGLAQDSQRANDLLAFLLGELHFPPVCDSFTFHARSGPFLRFGILCPQMPAHNSKICTDAPLYQYLSMLGLPVLNFNHIRTMYWT
jgi:hypothetical protein